jgi:DNA-binding transcriptional LysR family regulator
VYVDWGAHFRKQHDAVLPERARAALMMDLGPLAIQYLLANGGSGYFRTRVVQPYLERGQLERVSTAPEFSYPVYLVYSRAERSAQLSDALDVLRELLRASGEWLPLV